MPGPAIDIVAVDFATERAQMLADALEQELLGRYAGVPGSGGLPAPDVFRAPAGVFLVASADRRDVGCGGIARLDDETAELRRMYVAPDARGRGYGRVLLAALEDAARGLGYERLRLETGNLQVEALALYERVGYARIPCWGPFVDDPRSICLEREL